MCNHSQVIFAPQRIDLMIRRWKLIDTQVMAWDLFKTLPYLTVEFHLIRFPPIFPGHHSPQSTPPRLIHVSLRLCITSLLIASLATLTEVPVVIFAFLRANFCFFFQVASVASSTLHKDRQSSEKAFDMTIVTILAASSFEHSIYTFRDK